MSNVRDTNAVFDREGSGLRGQDSGNSPPGRGGRAADGVVPATLICHIDALLRAKGRVLAAIDGNSAAGKSTLAAELGTLYSCNVLHADDFFLRPFQRTPERLAEPGGNLDRERLHSEALAPLRAGQAFSYRPYDCKAQAFAPSVSMAPNALNIVEGVYSMHPLLAGLYDLKIFMGIPPEEQRRRLLERKPEMFDKFVNLWIPMEDKYFDAFGIREACDFVIDNA